MAFQQYDYLISKFEDGDFPTGQDFNDLIDSTYNFSLSNLPDIGTYIQAASGDWQSAYNTTNTLSAFWALKNEVLALTGGTIQGSLNVQGSMLSGNVNLFSIFQSKASDFQKLSFNKDTSSLEISNGNTVSLSGIQGFNTIVFSHAPFNPASNQTYYFGPVPNLVPTLNSRQSRQAVSQFNGEIVEASLVTDQIAAGSLQNTQIIIVNKTKNQTAVVKNNVLYKTVEQTIINVPLNTEPANFTSVQATFGSDGCKFQNDSSSLLRSSQPLNGTAFEYYIIKFGSSAYDSGSDQGRIEVGYSTEQTPVTYITRSELRGVINDGFNLVNSTVVLSSTDVITSPFISFRFKTATGTGLQRMANLQIIGINSNSDNIGNYTTSLNVTKGDILEARIITPTWTILPVGVINYVTAKIKTLN